MFPSSDFDQSLLLRVVEQVKEAQQPNLSISCSLAIFDVLALPSCSSAAGLDVQLVAVFGCVSEVGFVVSPCVNRRSYGSACVEHLLLLIEQKAYAK